MRFQLRFVAILALLLNGCGKPLSKEAMVGQYQCVYDKLGVTETWRMEADGKFHQDFKDTSGRVHSNDGTWELDADNRLLLRDAVQYVEAFGSVAKTPERMVMSLSVTRFMKKIYIETSPDLGYQFEKVN